MSGEPFEEPKDMIASMNGESEFKFRQEMKKYNDARSNHEIGYFEFKNGNYQNYFGHVMKYIKDHAG